MGRGGKKPGIRKWLEWAALSANCSAIKNNPTQFLPQFRAHYQNCPDAIPENSISRNECVVRGWLEGGGGGGGVESGERENGRANTFFSPPFRARFFDTAVVRSTSICLRAFRRLTSAEHNTRCAYIYISREDACRSFQSHLIWVACAYVQQTIVNTIVVNRRLGSISVVLSDHRDDSSGSNVQKIVI